MLLILPFMIAEDKEQSNIVTIIWYVQVENEDKYIIFQNWNSRKYLGEMKYLLSY